MPPSLMVRQRHWPRASPSDIGCDAGSSTSWIVAMSGPADASCIPFSLDSCSCPRRWASRGLAVSCQPAMAAVAASAKDDARSNTLCRRMNFLPGLFAFAGGDIGRQLGRRRHGNDVETGIDEMDFAGDARRHVAEQINRGVADMLVLDGLAQRTVMLVPAEHRARLADHRTGQRAHRPGRDRVDADAVAAQMGGGMAHARFEAGL